MISDIVCDEEVPEEMQADPELWSGCISGALTEEGFLEAFEDAGFYGVQILKRDEQPWRTVKGIEFRSLTVEAFKGKQGPCFERNQAVVYKGPFKAVLDDDDHHLTRGQRHAVCDKTFQLFKKAPYREHFDFIEPLTAVPIEEAQPFDCDRREIRHPRETKGLAYDATSARGELLRIRWRRLLLKPMNRFDEAIAGHGLDFTPWQPEILQVNVGKLCNLTCTHCHVNAGPKRKEIIARETVDRIIDWFAASEFPTLDLTGGAPEMIPDFRHFIERVRALPQRRRIIDRCNLTILLDPAQDGLAEFLAEHEIEIVASMPCYQPENVNAQRGDGVFDASIAALQLLNRLGYGTRPELPLHLVYNPNGDFPALARKPS